MVKNTFELNSTEHSEAGQKEREWDHNGGRKTKSRVKYVRIVKRTETLNAAVWHFHKTLQNSCILCTHSQSEHDTSVQIIPWTLNSLLFALWLYRKHFSSYPIFLPQNQAVHWVLNGPHRAHTKHFIPT